MLSLERSELHQLVGAAPRWHSFEFSSLSSCELCYGFFTRCYFSSITAKVSAFLRLDIVKPLTEDHNIYYSWCYIGQWNFSIFTTKWLVHSWFHRQIKQRNSITMQHFHIHILWLNSNVLVVLCIWVSCHLVAIHETTKWECDRTDIPEAYMR